MDLPCAWDRASVENFMSTLDSLPCALPDALVRHHLSRAGFATDDVRLERLIALVAQAFLADVARATLSYTDRRWTEKAGVVLTVDDVQRAFRDGTGEFGGPVCTAYAIDGGAAARHPSPQA